MGLGYFTVDRGAKRVKQEFANNIEMKHRSFFVRFCRYITVALRLGKTKRQKVLAWIMAIVVFAYIAAVAFTRSPMVLL